MKKYVKIKLESGKEVPHSTICGLKLAIKHKKLLPGTYLCECPNGNVHKWDIEHTSTHTSAGYAPRRKAQRQRYIYI